MYQTSATKQRDPLLDLWRGLALVDMAWVHLVTYPIGVAALLAAWIGDYTRFAAGAFVFISGLSVARIFGPKLAGEPAGVWATRRRLLRRALLLAGLDRLVAVAFSLIERSLSVPPTIAPRYPDIVDLLTFVEPGVTGGLLSLYAVLLVATPLLEAALRRVGGALVLAASGGLFALAHAGALGEPSTTWPFPVAYWQLLFVAGYVASGRFAALRDHSGHLARWWLAVVSLAFVALFLLRNGVSLDLVASSALPTWEFVKVPLSPAELAWYLAVTAFVLTWSAWLWERGPAVRWLLGWLPLLGRQSLLVYVAHLFVQLALVEALTLLDPSSLGRALILPLMALALIGVALAGEIVPGLSAKGASPGSRVALSWGLHPSAIIGSGVMAGALCAVLILQLLIGTPATWHLAPEANVRLEVATGAEADANIASADEEDPDPEPTPWFMDLEADGYPGSSIDPEAISPEETGSETQG